MKIKKYRGQNMQKVIAKVKSDLGPNAIILHTRKFKKGGFFGFFAKKMVEVVATVEEEKKPKIDPLQEELKEMKGAMGDLMMEMKNNKQENLKFMANPLQQKLIQPLWKLGFGHDTAQNLAQQVIKGMGGYLVEDEAEIKNTLKEELIKDIGEIESIKLEKGQTKVVALMGPTGVGKTTTLAKLAAKFSLFEEKKVGLITADTYRIAAVDQLKTYSEIINLPLEVVFTPQELEDAIEAYQGYDLVLVDTAGRSQNNQVHISELKGFINNTSIDEIYLVLSATTKTSDALKIIETYNQIDFDRLIITKIDETDSLGIIFEAIKEAKRPLSYITIGQDVPEDIKLAKSNELVEDIVKELEL